MKKTYFIIVIFILLYSTCAWCSEMVYPLIGYEFRPVSKGNLYAELAGSSQKTTYDPVIEDEYTVVGWEEEVSTITLLSAYDATPELSVNLTIPYVEKEKTSNSGTSISENGPGDISAGIKYRLLNRQEFKGDIFFLLKAGFPTGKSPYETDGELSTGSGGYSLTPEFTMIRKLNNAFPFCSLSYQHNFEIDNLSYKVLSDGEAGISLHKVKPGASYGIRFGFVELFSENISFLMGYNFKKSEKSTLYYHGKSDVQSESRDESSYEAGLGFLFSSGLGLFPVFSVGTGDEAPDYELSLRIVF